MIETDDEEAAVGRLLTEVAGHVDPAAMPPDLPARARRRRRTRAGLLVAPVGVALVAALVVVPALSSTGRDADDALVGPSASTSPLDPGNRLELHGVSISLPEGWKVAVPEFCQGLKDKTGRLSDFFSDADALPSCPASGERPTPRQTMELGSLFAAQRISPALREGGREVTWQGQPAFLLEETDDYFGPVASLAVPRFNVVVRAMAPDPGTARELLDLVDVPAPAADLQVPDAAESVFLQSFAGGDLDGGGPRNATITDAAEVSSLLAELARLPITDERSSTCDASTSRQVVVITVMTDGQPRSFQARFDECGDVVTDNGAVARTTPQLKADLQRLIPNSGIV